MATGKADTHVITVHKVYRFRPLNIQVLPIPIGLLASLIILIEKAKSSRWLVKRQNSLNSSKVMLWKEKNK